MRRKWNTCIFAVLATAILSGTAVVSASETEFTDISECIAEAEFEQAVFSDGEQLKEEENVFEEDLEFQYIPETDSYKLVKGVDRGSVYIPREINGKLVTGIEENAFVNCTSLRLVVVDGPVMVERRAFVNCPRLREFSVKCFPDKPKFAVGAFDSDSKVIVTALGGIHSSELDECDIFHFDIEDVSIDYNEQQSLCYVDYHSKWYVQDYDDSNSKVLVEKFADIIGRRAFYGCNKLQEVVIANGPVSIETKAFSDCSNLQKVVIPATVKDISSDAFEGTDKVVIYAPKGSYALNFAKENGIACKVSDLEKMPRPELEYVRNKNSNRFVTLKWNPVPYADGYQLYRFNSDRRKYELIATIKNLDRLYYSKEIDPEQTEYFKVRAYSDSAVYAEKYSPSSMKVTVQPIPDKVIIRTVLAKYPNKLGIYWRQREDADGYLIYRSETEPYKGYKKIKYITNNSTTKYMDTGVKKGRTYYYRVRAYKMRDGKRAYGPLSDPYKVTCK